MAITAAKLEAEVTANTAPAEQKLKGFGSTIKGLATPFNLAKAAAGAFMGTAIVGGAGKAIMAASDLNEETSKTGVVFGKSTGIVLKNADAMAKSFGLPKTELIGAASNIGLVAQASGLGSKASADLSNNFANLAADASSFYNVPMPDALEAMRSGLVGESEPMRQFGVLLSEQAVQQEAVRLGLAKSGAQLTEQQKVQARASLITKGLSKAHGDLARTQSSVANRMRELKGRLQNFAAEMGAKALPAAQAFLGWIMDAPKHLAPFMGVLNTVVGYVKGFIRGLQGAQAGGSGFMVTVVNAGNAIRQAFQAVMAFVTGSLIPSLRNLWSIIGPLLGEAFRTVSGILTAQILPAFKMASGSAGGLGAILVSVTGFLRDHATAVRAVLTGILAAVVAVKAFSMAQTAVATAINVAKGAMMAGRVAMMALNLAMSANPIGLVVVALIALAAGLVYAYKHSETFRNIVNGAFTAVKNTVASVVGWITGTFVPFFTQTVPNAIRTGVNFIKAHWGLLVSIIGGPIAAVAVLVIKHWSQIKAAFSAAINAIVSGARKWASDVRGVFAGAVNGIKRVVSAALSFLRGLWQREVNGWKRIISGAMGLIKGAVSAGVTGVKNAIARLSAIAGQIRGYWNSAISAVKTRISSMVSIVRGLPGRIRSAVGNLSGVLIGAGRSIISGLIRGLNEKLGELRSKLGQITGFIQAHKGPRRVDMKLLTPAGQVIMDGLMRGLESRLGALRTQLGGITRTVQNGIVAGEPGQTNGRVGWKGRVTRKTPLPPLRNPYNYERGGVRGPGVSMTFNTYYPRAEPQSVTTNKALQRAGALGLVG